MNCGSLPLLCPDCRSAAHSMSEGCIRRTYPALWVRLMTFTGYSALALGVALSSKKVAQTVQSWTGQAEVTGPNKSERRPDAVGAWAESPARAQAEPWNSFVHASGRRGACAACVACVVEAGDGGSYSARWVHGHGACAGRQAICGIPSGGETRPQASSTGGGCMQVLVRLKGVRVLLTTPSTHPRPHCTVLYLNTPGGLSADVGPFFP
jgi:hypothetical protein